MKNAKTLKAQLLMLVFLGLVLSFTGCNNSEDFYPKEELKSIGIDKENLEYFKQAFSEYDDFFFEDYAIRVGSHGGDFNVKLYGLDVTGKALDSYDVQGDILTDIVIGITGDMDPMGYSYDFQVTEGEKENTITGTRKISEEILENQDYNLKSYKDFLSDAGYPESRFDYCRISGTLHYGKFEIDGDMKTEILDILYDKSRRYSDAFEFTQEKGVIHTKAIDI